MSVQPADIVISFDTTGSMYPCLTQVRREVDKTVKELFESLPDLRVSIISHGDYCDGSQRINILDFTTNQKKISDFIKNAPATSGGDSEECYELVLSEAKNLSWDKKRNKALVLIGDDLPHKVGYNMSGYWGGVAGRLTIDWKKEAKHLAGEGVALYAIQALGRRYAESFYQELADIGGTPKLDLAQFAQVTQLLQAICYKQSNKLSEFEALLRAKATATIDFSLLNNLDLLAGRKKGSTKTSLYTKRKDGLEPVHPSRFQVMNVSYDTPIKDFVQSNGVTFKVGRGFYEFTKTEDIQDYKEIIVQDRKTGEMFSGENARKVAGIPDGRVHMKPDSYIGYRIFIQSTSNNRRLKAGTNFLYEVEGLV